MTASTLATGTRVFETAPVEGSVYELTSPEEVLQLLDDGVDGVIALVHKQGATFLGPLLPNIVGIVCTAGTPRAHLGIVAREWQIACIMGADLTGETPANGTAAVIDCSAEPGKLVAA